MVVGEEPECYGSLLLQSHQKRLRLRDRQSILRSLRQNADEPQFGNRASQYFVAFSVPEPHHPVRNAVMKLVFEKAQRDQRVHIEKISHGRSDRIS